MLIEVDRWGQGMATQSQLSAWIERMAAHFVPEGIPLIGGRILAYLLVCDPVERTAAELSEELEASSGSISTNVRLLMNLGVVTKTTRRGRQAAEYKLNEQGWNDMIDRRLRALAGTRELTAAGLRLLSGDPQRAQRLRNIDEMYGWLADELPAVWERRPAPPRG